MVKFKDFSRPLNVFQALFKANLFSKTFQDSPIYSSTFQACVNPVKWDKYPELSETQNYVYWDANFFLGVQKFHDTEVLR